MQEFTHFLSQHPAMTTAMLVIFILLVLLELWRAKRREQSLTPQAAIQLINHQNAMLIDIRSPEAFQQGHIIGALSMQKSALQSLPKHFEKNKDKPIILVCNNGSEVAASAVLLKKQGYKVQLLKGGMRAWIEAGLPTVRK